MNAAQVQTPAQAAGAEKPRRVMRPQPLDIVNVPGALLNRATVEVVCGRKKSTINRDIKAKRFPAPHKQTKRASHWLSDHIRAWIAGTWQHPSQAG